MKINIPAVISGMTIGNNTLNATIKDLSNILLIKVSGKDTIFLRGSNKYKSRKVEIENLVTLFYLSHNIERPPLEITFTENISKFHNLGSTEGLIAAMYYGLSELHRHGLTRDEIFRDIISDGIIKTPSSKSILYNLLKGGLIASIPVENLFQKIYLPKGIKMVVFLPKSTRKRDSEEHEMDLQQELASFILAMQVSNFEALRKSLSKLNKDFEGYDICIENNALGIVRSDHVYIALCQNTLDSENIKSQFNSTNYTTTSSSFEKEGITLY